MKPVISLLTLTTLFYVPFSATAMAVGAGASGSTISLAARDSSTLSALSSTLPLSFLIFYTQVCTRSYAVVLRQEGNIHRKLVCECSNVVSRLICIQCANAEVK